MTGCISFGMLSRLKCALRPDCRLLGDLPADWHSSSKPASLVLTSANRKIRLEKIMSSSGCHNVPESLPLVSVILPTNCDGQFVEQTLESVLAQTYSNFELLIVDDGSTDDTVERLKNFARRDPRVSLFYQQGRGEAAARNLALRNARGSYIAPLHWNQIWLPDYLEKQVDSLMSAPDTVALSYAWSIDVDQWGRLNGGFRASRIHGDVYNTLLCNYFPISTSTCLIDRRCIDEVGSFNSEFYCADAQGCEEWELLVRIAGQFGFRPLKEFLVLNRVAEGPLDCERLAASQQMMLEEAVLDQPDMPGLFNSISRSVFFTHLSYLRVNRKDFGGALLWLKNAFLAQPFVFIFNAWNYSLLLKCALSAFKRHEPESDSDEESVCVSTANGADLAARVAAAAKSKKWLVAAQLFAYDLLNWILKPFFSRIGTGSRKVSPVTLKWLEERRNFTFTRRVQLYEALAKRIDSHTDLRLPNEMSVSIIIPTLDRPDDLRECLFSLISQQSLREREIVVVDNDPESGLISHVVSEFPEVKLVSEWRQGVSYARNAGIVASTGDVCVFVDDDTIAPPDWLERLIAPLSRDGVLAVVGNALPYELDSPAAMLFEHYSDGSFDRGFNRWDADSDWFMSHRLSAVNTWLLSGSGNVAFRSAAFADPKIGLFKEYLGPGMPSGGCEDTYQLYKTLKAGWTVAYEPFAFVWNKHRSIMRDLKSQLHSCSTGMVSYLLTTLFEDGDLRAVPALALLPVWHGKRIVLRWLGQSSHPIELILKEAVGHIAGPIALLRSIQAVNEEGFSEPYVPVSRRVGPPVSKVQLRNLQVRRRNVDRSRVPTMPHRKKELVAKARTHR